MPSSRLPAAARRACPKRPAPAWRLPISSDPWGRRRGAGIQNPESGWQELWAQTPGCWHCQQHRSWLEGAGCYSHSILLSAALEHSQHAHNARGNVQELDNHKPGRDKKHLYHGDPSSGRGAGGKIICVYCPHTPFLFLTFLLPYSEARKVCLAQTPSRVNRTFRITGTEQDEKKKS